MQEQRSECDGMFRTVSQRRLEGNISPQGKQEDGLESLKSSVAADQRSRVHVAGFHRIQFLIQMKMKHFFV